MAEIAKQIPSLERIVVVPYLSQSPELARLERDDIATPMTWGQLAELGEERSSTSSGSPSTTPVGPLLLGNDRSAEGDRAGSRRDPARAAEEGRLHLDAQPGDRIFWFTTTGWMMWNFLVGALLTPASIVLYDGSPGQPDMGVLWDLAERTGRPASGPAPRTSPPA